MPRVPSVSNFSNGLNNSPTTLIADNQSQAEAIGAKQMTDLGNARMSAGQGILAIETDKAMMANQLRVDDGMNQAKAEALRLTYDKSDGYSNIKGVNALERPDGKPLADEYADRLNQKVDQIRQGLGSDAQRRAFDMNVNGLMTQFKGSIQQHEGAEFKDYAASVRKGTIANRQQEITLNYSNPVAVNEAVNSIKAASYDLAVNQLGKSAEEGEAFSRAQTSDAHKRAIMAALEDGNVTYADAYFNKYSKDNQMDAEDILAVKGTLNTQVDATLAAGAVAKTTQKYLPAFKPNDMDRLTNIVQGLESGNRGDFNADGTLVTSPTGAKGRMQVLDSTNLDPGFGVTPAKMTGDPKTDAEERARVGRDYLKAMVSRYGDPEKGLAAYNQGPGTVDDAIAKAKAAGNADTWLSYVPKEGQVYAANGMKKFNAGAGATNLPTEYDYVTEAINQLGPDARAQAVKATRDTATAQYKVLAASVKQEQDQAKANAIREMQTNGGNFAALTPSVRAALAPEDVDTVRKAGINDITNPVVYNQLSNNPQELLQYTDDQFLALRGELSLSDWKHFDDQRKGTGEKSPTNLNSASLNSVLNNRLAQAGLDPTPKDGSNSAEEVAGIRRIMNEAVLTEQKVKGRQLTDVETQQVVDKMFALHSPTGWFGSSKPAIQRGYGGIPSATRDSIKKQLIKKGKTDPTDADILAVYMAQMYSSSKDKPNG